MSKEALTRLESVVSTFEPRLGEKITMSPDEVRFQSLLLLMETKTVSYRDAVIIVGGRGRLDKLLIDGKIRCFKPAGASNRKWQINAADCYSNVKPRLNEVLKKRNASSVAV